jgi:micrococcal nuclease
MYEYRAKVKRVVDGDTLDLEVDLGFTVKVDIRARLFGIDAPEMHGVRHDSEEYQKGVAAKDAIEDWLISENPTVIVKSFDGAAIGQGKYGRWLVEVWDSDGGGDDPEECLNKHLVLEGHAVERDY